MDISIIIPCYNLEKYLAKCLQSVLSQKYDSKMLEIILVLDSCTDNSKTVAHKLLSSGEITYYILEVNFRNAGLARNAGIDVAKGEYIYFLDGDDYLVDEFAFNKLIDNMLIKKSNVVYMTAFECDDKEVIDADAIWRFFFKRKLINESRFPPALINEDWAFIRELKLKPYYIESQIDGIFYHYTYPREGSVTEFYRKLHPRIYK